MENFIISSAPVSPNLEFQIEEYQHRLQRTQAEMEKNGLSLMLIHKPENILYLSGFYTSTGFFSYHALAVPSHGDPVMVVRDLEIPTADTLSWVRTYSTYADAVDPVPVWMAAAARAVKAMGYENSRVGIDEHSWFLTVERYKELQKLLPHTTFVAEPHIVDMLRVIKSPKEIEYMREGGRMVEAGMRAGLAKVFPGTAENELAAAVFEAEVKAGSMIPIIGIITSGKNDQLHGAYGDKVLKSGDIAYFELVATSHKYDVKMMRSATVGKPTSEQRYAADLILSTQDNAIAMMNPGTPASVIDTACREPILAAGLRDTYTNRVGYSIGLNYRPSAGEFIREFVPGVEWALQPGMVFHMLMMAAGHGFSESVLITENGPERLTKLERSLFYNE